MLAWPQSVNKADTTSCSRMRAWISACIFTLLSAFAFHNCNAHSDNVKLLLISFDGFRWDYLDMVREAGRRTPNFDLLIENGVKAKYGTKNIFVTKTFPNHYSLATGMYEENHGVVANQMFDPRWNETFDKSDPAVNTKLRWWNNGTNLKPSDPGYRGPEPIWITNEKEKTDAFQRRSGVMFWPGSEVEHMRPFHWMPYDASLRNETRIDHIIEWFTDDENPINLGLLYFSEPDHLGHKVGPNDPSMIEMIVELDGLVGYLIKKLKANHLFDHMNIIITSDHGMAQIHKTPIDLSRYINLTDIEVSAGNSPGINIIPKKGEEDKIIDLLKDVKHLNVYRKDEVPADYHYRHNFRILDLVVTAEVGYDVYLNATASAWGQRGNHGYNNSAQDMHPFFIAHGPEFKKNFVSTEMFNSIDIYPLMCKILDVEPGAHDGSLANIEHILQEETHSLLSLTMITFVLAAMLAATVAGVFSVAACRVYRITKHRKRHLVLPLNMIDGQTHLLATDDEEIP